MTSVFAKWQKKVAKPKVASKSDRLVQCFNMRAKPKVKSRPTGLHIAPNGDIIITDYVDKNVKIFSKKGALKKEIGSGYLKRPWNAVMTSKGEIAVSDPGTPDVKLFTAQGRYIKSFNFVTNFQDPYGLALTCRGEILVADKGANCIYIYNDEGFMMGSCKPHEEETIIQWPQYVVSGHRLVVNANGAGINHLVEGDTSVESISGKLVLGERASANNNIFTNTLSQKVPPSTAEQSNDMILVTDYPNHALYCLGSNGRVRFRVGGSGTELGQFVCPEGLAVDKYGNILVADNANDRIQMISAQSSQIEWKTVISKEHDGLEGPEALAIDSDGQLVVTEGATGLVKTFKYEAHHNQ